MPTPGTVLDIHVISSLWGKWRCLGQITPDEFLMSRKNLIKLAVQWIAIGFNQNRQITERKLPNSIQVCYTFPYFVAQLCDSNVDCDGWYNSTIWINLTSKMPQLSITS